MLSSSKYFLRERIIENVCDVIGTNEQLVNMSVQKLDSRLEYTELPEIYEFGGIDGSKKPAKLKELCLNIEEIIYKQKNYVLWFNSFKHSGFVITKLMEQYITQKLIEDEHIVSMLYIDTNLFLNDYKKLINKSTSPDDIQPRTVYGLEALYHKIYDAEFVFWDKFNFVNTNYDWIKLYEILSTRFLHRQGNIFCVKSDNIQTLYENMDTELINVMSIDKVVDLTREQYDYLKQDNI